MTKINQFMTSDWFHSGKEKSTTCIDIQYVGKGIPWAVQPDTRNDNVDISKTNSLANEFRKFGFDGLSGGWNIISQNGNGTGAILDNSASVSPHQNHFHVQTFSDIKIKVVESQTIISNIPYNNSTIYQSNQNFLNRIRSSVLTSEVPIIKTSVDIYNVIFK